MFEKLNVSEGPCLRRFDAITSQQIEIKGKSIYCTELDYKGIPCKMPIRINISSQKGQNFLSKLQSLRLNRRRKSYDNRYILDGCMWELSYTADGETSKTYGINEFPAFYTDLCALILKTFGVKV